MDLQKEQDSNTHGSGWMLVICKHWNWNWHWNWKYYFFLTKGGDIVWVTASTKLRGLLITWSGDKVTDLYLVFHNTYGHQTCQSSNLRWGGVPSKSRDLLITWSRDKCKTLYLHFCNTYGHQTWQSSNLWWRESNFQSHVTYWLYGHVANEKKHISALQQYLWPPNMAQR